MRTIHRFWTKSWWTFLFPSQTTKILNGSFTLLVLCPLHQWNLHRLFRFRSECQAQGWDSGYSLGLYALRYLASDRNNTNQTKRRLHHWSLLGTRLAHLDEETILVNAPFTCNRCFSCKVGKVATSSDADQYLHPARLLFWVWVGPSSFPIHQHQEIKLWKQLVTAKKSNKKLKCTPTKKNISKPKIGMAMLKIQKRITRESQQYQNWWKQ